MTLILLFNPPPQQAEVSWVELDLPLAISDAGAETDAAAVAANATGADSAALVDSASLSAIANAADSGSQTESASLAVQVSDADSATLVDSASTGGPADSGTL